MAVASTEQSSLALICEIGAAITSSMVLEDVLTTVAQRTAEAFGVWECDFFEYDPVREKLIAAACWARQRTPADDAWVGQVFDVDDETHGLRDVIRRAEIREECIDDPSLSDTDVAVLSGWGEKSAISVPLVFEGRVLGCLSLIEKREIRRFSDAEKQLLRTLSLPAAVAIHNAKVYRRLEERARQLTSLLGATRALASTVVLEELLALVARTVGTALDVPYCLIYEYEVEGDALVWRSEYAADPAAVSEDRVGSSYALGDYPADRAILEGDAVVEQHASDESLDEATRRSMRDNDELSCLSVPVKFEGEPLGILEIVETRFDRAFSEDDLHLARALAEQVAVAIHNARLYQRLEAQNQRLVALFDASQAISESEDVDGLFAGVAEWAARLFAEREGWAAVTIADERGLRAVAAGGGAEQPAAAAADDALAALAESERRPAQDMLDDGRSRLVVPLPGGAGGHLEVRARLRRRFDDKEVELLQILVAQAGAAAENLRGRVRDREQQEQVRALNRRLNAFVELSEQMRGLVDEHQLLRLLGRVMEDVLEYRQWAAYLYEPAAKAFRVVGSLGDDPALEARQRGREVPAAVLEGLLAAAVPVSCSFFVDHRRHEWSDDEHYWFPAEDLGPRQPGEWHFDDTLFVPMRTELGSLLGYIEAYDPADRRLPTVDSVRLLEVFAAKAASDIEVHRLYEQLEEQARSDGLTELLNHRYFMERLEEEVTKARRYGIPLALLMMDLDDFKPFNDTYGHPQGDEVLRGFAGILRAMTRDKVDLVARYGGEEFVVLLPATPAAGGEDPDEAGHDAMAVAERIRCAMAEHRFEGFPGRPEATVTVSVGVATFPEQAASGAELVANADKALYLAKHLGKDRVRSYA